MTQARALGNALMVALISIVLMLGALSISLVEFVPQTTPTAANFLPPSPLPVTVTPTIQPTTTPLLLESPPATLTFTPTITATPPSSCPIPAGWGQVVVQSFETLESIALRYRTSAADLYGKNCLASYSLVAGSVLYVPPVPTNTAVLCVQGSAGWMKNYTVRSGDTFYAVAYRYMTDAATLKRVNCRVSDLLYAGELLWVPNVTPRTPIPTLPGATSTLSYPNPTDPLTETPLPFTITPVPSFTPVPNTPTAVPTNTLVPTSTLTAFP